MSAVLAAQGIPRDRVFYTGMALVAGFTVALGFSPTFYVRGASLPPLSPLLIVHGIVFTAWIALLVTQTALVAANRRDIHRKLGIFGACLAAVMLVLMVLASLASLRLGRAPVEGLDPRSFFAIPMRDIVTFPLLVGAAVWLRRDPESHKRLMILATLTILDAAIARWPGVSAYGPPMFYAIQDLMIAAALIYDFVSRGHVHRAYKWGAALIVLSQPLFLAISGTPAWLAFADSLQG
jgi:hypothetical protein